MEELEKKINEKESKNDHFSKIKSIHDYYSAKKENLLIINMDNNKKENDNIYIKYLENPDIIFQGKGDINNENLKLLFNELNKDMDEGNNILFPFLDICSNLVKAYVESDLDDINIEKEEIITPSFENMYLKKFEKLKNNCFISKEILFPIYDYLSNIYDIIIDAKELTKQHINSFKKFNKIIKLFEIFYDTDINIDKVQRNESSFCFIGGGIKISFDQIIQLPKDGQIIINLNFKSNYFKYLNENLFFIKVNDDEIKYKELKNIELKTIQIIIINSNNQTISYDSEKKKNCLLMKVDKEVKDISLFEQFYGQITSIDVIIVNDKNNNIKYQFLPLSIRNQNIIYYIKKTINILKDKKTKNNQFINNKLKDIIPKLIIENKNLVNINYINYNDDKFDIIDYLGGIIQFLPFYRIFKNLNIIEINNKNEINKNESGTLSYSKSFFSKYEISYKEELNGFINNLIKIMLKKLFSLEKKEKIFKKYICFIYYLLLDLGEELFIVLNDYEQSKNLELLSMIFFNIKNIYFSNIKDEIKNFIEQTKIKEIIFKRPKKSLNQLYNEYMKQLFCFNNFWSKRYIFFPKRYNNNLNNKEIEIKYKQINYYTKNFQFPFFYPILEYKKYYPNFKHFKGDLFKKNKDKFLEYNFNLDINDKAKKIIDLLISENNKNNNKSIFEKCCLVKKMHHINGKLVLINSQKHKNIFNLIFQPIKDTKQNDNIYCLKNEIIKKKENKIKNITNNNNSSNILCYGSVFPCPEREKIRNVIINSKDILFILIRIYYYRVSGIEIFTINKSYYFNFQNPIDLNNIKTNILLNEIKNNSSFKEIKLKNDKLIIGYYNKKYKPYLFPLFNGEIDYWDNKIDYSNNYDKIVLINIFSNRSFRDIFQYPVFPILYDTIGIKRQMENHIGFQNINIETKTKRNIFVNNLILNMEDEVENAENKEEIYLFNIHYSNPAFVINYLLRVLPYSFLAIEFQGDSFDDPNRLFFSIENTLKSTVNLKSDLREMIPELYYMIELFYNKNEISFGELYDGRKIDNVLIKEKENIESDIKRKENYAQFLYIMRKNLEKEKEINKWIDLIFGVNQNYYIPNDKYKYRYYEKSSEVYFKNDSSILNDKITMDKVNFGLLPYQLFKEEFPEEEMLEKRKEIEKKLKTLNTELFKDEHIKIKSPIQTFICKGRILIDDNYIKIIDKDEKRNKLKLFFNSCYKISSKRNNTSKINNTFYNKMFGELDIENTKINDIENMNIINYYFIGDVFGNVLVYNLKELNKNENEEKNKKETIDKKEEDIYNNRIVDSNFIEINYKLIITLINKLNHHSKEIKYIDFNPRLNILLSYSLDNFINIYIVPKFKLINVIDTYSFRNENDKNDFDEVVLLSYPFPSIVCHNKEYIYYLSINGELIKYDKLYEGEKIIFSIDKNLSIVEDRVEIYDFDNKLKSIFNIFK